MNGNSFKYSGYVESLNVKGDGPNSHQCLFALVSKDGKKHWSFLLDPNPPTERNVVMANLLIAAWANGKPVKLNSKANGGAPEIATEIEVERGP